MHDVSTFAASYAAGRGERPVEAIAVVVSDGAGPEPNLRFIVVDEQGRASLADARELDLYGVWLRAQIPEDEADSGTPGP